MGRPETKALHQNDETEALKSIGDKSGARISDEKAAKIVDAYNKVCQAVELEPRYDRMYVGRYVHPQQGELVRVVNVQQLTIAQGNAKIIPPFRMNLQLFAAPRKPQKYKTLYLERREYAHVVSEIYTHLSDVRKEQRIITKVIWGGVYTFVNNGFNNYRFIDRVPIDQETIGEVDS